MTLGLLACTVLFFLVFVTGVMLFPYVYYMKLDKEMAKKPAVKKPATAKKPAAAKKAPAKKSTAKTTTKK